MIRLVPYRVRATLPLDSPPPLLQSALGVSFGVSQHGWTGSLPFKPTSLDVVVTQPGSGKTTLSATWVFEELWSDEPANDLSGETLFQENLRVGGLYVPGTLSQLYPTRGIPVLELLFEFLAPGIYRLAVRAMAPQFIKAYWNCRNERHGHGTIDVEGHSLRLQPQAWWSSSTPPEKALDAAQVGDTFGNPLLDHEMHVAYADLRLMAGDLRSAITSLATAMEVAAYAFKRRICPETGDVDFKPRLYFTRSKDTVKRLSGIATYIGSRALPPLVVSELCSLWGTRNEILHNGKLAMRPSRALPPDQNDYSRFRENLSAALVWMAHPAIE